MPTSKAPLSLKGAAPQRDAGRFDSSTLSDAARLESQARRNLNTEAIPQGSPKKTAPAQPLPASASRESAIETQRGIGSTVTLASLASQSRL